jgi:hypothetical protein
MRAMTAQRWANARQTLLQGRRPNSDNASQLHALDAQLQTVSNDNQAESVGLICDLRMGPKSIGKFFKSENPAEQRRSESLDLTQRLLTNCGSSAYNPTSAGPLQSADVCFVSIRP